MCIRIFVILYYMCICMCIYYFILYVYMCFYCFILYVYMCICHFILYVYMCSCYFVLLLMRVWVGTISIIFQFLMHVEYPITLYLLHGYYHSCLRTAETRQPFKPWCFTDESRESVRGSPTGLCISPVCDLHV